MRRRLSPQLINPNAFQPIAEINTTPLIDLMLVLLIMFIISVPVSTHKVPVDLPQPTPTPREPPPVHLLNLDAGGRLHWDGRPIADSELPARLARMVADPAQPVLHMGAEAETRYERFDQALGTVRRAGITRLGFVGNQRFENALDR
jgi:biopolymer transport protein ExbD